MLNPKSLLLVLLCGLLLYGCDYIVLPEEDLSDSTSDKGWSGVVTNVGNSATGGLHIDLTLRNETGDWSTMQAVEKPAVLTDATGKTTNCEAVVVSTGGHRLAPGFQMRGFTTGTATDPKPQTLYVECEGGEVTPGSKIALDYIYYTGEYNYYESDANKANGTMELNLHQVESALVYPVAEAQEGVIQKADAEIVALNNVVLTLAAAERTDEGLEFSWHTLNPGEYPSYVHIGKPPAIGSDGIIYGRYESPDLAAVPVTGAGITAEWTTNVAVPPEVKGLYILLSVESKKQRLFVNYAVDISDK